jgi:3-oxoacyl-[acyl-carrier-protein] synthase-3
MGLLSEQGCFLHGIGHFHPDSVIDNAFLEALDIGVDRRWIADRVGIEQRRSVLPLDYIRSTRNRDPRATAECAEYSNIDLSVRAARCALDRARLEPSAIGMVIAGGCSPETTVPAEACRIAAALGVHAIAFDINGSCVSFIVQIHLLNTMDPSALPDFILVVNGESNTRVTDYNDRSVAVLWGDGAAAAVLSRRVPSGLRFTGTLLGTDSSGVDLIRTPTGGHFRQNGNAVQQFAVRRTAELFQGVTASSAANGYFIGHQANLRMLESACRRSGVPAEAHWTNVAMFGNCGAAGAPAVLSEHWPELRGTSVHLGVVGAGLTWGSAHLKGANQP